MTSWVTCLEGNKAGAGTKKKGPGATGPGEVMLEWRPERQGNNPVEVREPRLREQQGQRPQDRSELVGARPREQFWETEWPPGALPKGSRCCQDSSWWGLLSAGPGPHEASPEHKQG